MFHFQLYRACPAIKLKPGEDPTPLLSSRIREKTRNQTQINFSELADDLQDAHSYADKFTFLDDSKLSRELLELNEPFVKEEFYHLLNNTHLHAAETDVSKIKRRKRYVSTDRKTEVSDLNKTDMLKSSNHVVDEPDMDYYSDTTAEDFKIEASVLLDSFKKSIFSDEGCIPDILEPMDTARRLRPFSGDGYILKSVFCSLNSRIQTLARF